MKLNFGDLSKRYLDHLFYEKILELISDYGGLNNSNATFWETYVSIETTAGKADEEMVQLARYI